MSVTCDNKHDSILEYFTTSFQAAASRFPLLYVLGKVVPVLNKAPRHEDVASCLISVSDSETSFSSIMTSVRLRIPTRLLTDYCVFNERHQFRVSPWAGSASATDVNRLQLTLASSTRIVFCFATFHSNDYSFNFKLTVRSRTFNTRTLLFHYLQFFRICSTPGRDRDSSLRHSVQIRSEVHPASYTMFFSGGLSGRGVKLTAHLHLEQ